MKPVKILLSAVALLWAVQIPLTAFAQEDMPEVKTSNGVAYTSGGVGEMEREAMKEHARDYNLRLTFAVKSGGYLANVKVDIKNAKGHPLVADVSDGPWFYAKLPPGKYKVFAESEGKCKTRNVTVAKGRVVMAKMIWPDE